MKPDALIDQVVKPGCKSLLHKVPDEVQPILKRARERYQAGEKLNCTALTRIINTEYGTTIPSMSLLNFLKGVGCRCD